MLSSRYSVPWKNQLVLLTTQSRALPWATAAFSMQQMCFLQTSYLAAWHNHMCTQGSRHNLNRMSNFCCFINSVLDVKLAGFVHRKDTVEHNNDYYSMASLPWYLSRQRFYPPRLLKHQCKCQQSEKGKQSVSIIMKIVLTAQTPWKGLRDPERATDHTLGTAGLEHGRWMRRLGRCRAGGRRTWCVWGAEGTAWVPVGGTKEVPGGGVGRGGTKCTGWEGPSVLH